MDNCIRTLPNISIFPLVLLLPYIQLIQVSIGIAYNDDCLSPECATKIVAASTIIGRNTDTLCEPLRDPKDQKNSRKNSFHTPYGQRSLMHLDWKVYSHIKYLYRSGNLTTGMHAERFAKENQDALTFINDFEETYGISSSDHLPVKTAKILENITLNPLSVYKAVARSVDYFNTWIRRPPLTEDNFTSEITFFLRNECQNSCELIHNLMDSAISAILKIHQVYDLKAKDISRGCVAGICTKIALNAKDCFRFGSHAISLKLFSIGVEWLELALRLVQNTPDKTVKYQDVYNEMDRSARAKSVMQPQALEIDTNRTKRQIDLKHWAICKGQVQQSDKKKSKLFCWYERKIHMSFSIGPIKAELLSMHPELEVVQYHDIISESTTVGIKNFNFADFANFSDEFVERLAWLKE